MASMSILICLFTIVSQCLASVSLIEFSDRPIEESVNIQQEIFSPEPGECCIPVDIYNPVSYQQTPKKSLQYTKHIYRQHAKSIGSSPSGSSSSINSRTSEDNSTSSPERMTARVCQLKASGRQRRSGNLPAITGSGTRFRGRRCGRLRWKECGFQIRSRWARRHMRSKRSSLARHGMSNL